MADLVSFEAPAQLEPGGDDPGMGAYPVLKNASVGWGITFPDDTDNLRLVLYGLEYLIEMAALVVLHFWMRSLRKTEAINTNLKFVLRDAAITMAVICLTRFVLSANIIAGSPFPLALYFVFSGAHDISMAHIGDMQLTFVVERLLAFKYLRTYELRHNQHKPIVLIVIIFTWLTSCFRIWCYFRNWLRPNDVSVACLVLTIIAALVHCKLFMLNKHTYLSAAAVATLSARYQLVENMKAQIPVIIFTLVSLIHNSTTLVIRLIIAYVITPNRDRYMYAIADHVWNISTACYFCLYPLGFIFKRQAVDFGNRVTQSNRVGPVNESEPKDPRNSIKSVIGRELFITDEGRAYFQQLRDMWT